MGQLYQDAAQGALAKLDNLLPDEQRDEVTWARRLSSPRDCTTPAWTLKPPPWRNCGVPSTVCRVNMVYQSASTPEPGVRKLDPYALAFHWGWWYVVGHCHIRQEVRTFRIDRIQELTLLGEVFQSPADFNAREFMSRDFQGQTQVQCGFASQQNLPTSPA